MKQGLKHMRSWLLCCFTFDCQAHELSAGHGFTALICHVQGHDHCRCRGAELPDLLSCWTTTASGDIVNVCKINVTRIQSKGSTWHTSQTCM